ncbi:hypothetical protein [Arcticibacterium luteifluviistationis]|uniref:DUF2721 domain-containing protein n=1 Tax=Arcticibacterium luteifluviistationis TaxID=1784714 RepID=A0A2Z4GBM0_9BACT|nr:hypothetical protein [Arcticibacterium luteifluviistationis]AWV98468.1 hypothetical protein DJ013_09905 [Arcticibacterium luteifluviistationis]
METWQINLSLIPSLAVILGSVNRMALGLTDELNNRLHLDHELFEEIIPLKIKQLKTLSIATLLMYLSLLLLVINAMLGGLNVFENYNTAILIIIAVFIFFVSIILLVSFSWNAYFIRQRQFEKFLL